MYYILTVVHKAVTLYLTYWNCFLVGNLTASPVKGMLINTALNLKRQKHRRVHNSGLYNVTDY